MYTTPRPQVRTHDKKPMFITVNSKYIFKTYNIIFNGAPIFSTSGLSVNHVYLYDTKWIVDWYFMNYPDDDNVTFKINGGWHRQWHAEYYHLQLNIISQKYQLLFIKPIHLIRLDNGAGMQVNFTDLLKLGNELILGGMGMGWDIHTQDATTAHHSDTFPVAGQHTGFYDITNNPILVPYSPPEQIPSEPSKYHYMQSTDFWPKLYKDETRPPIIVPDPYLSVRYYHGPILGQVNCEGQSQGQIKCEGQVKGQGNKSRKPKSRKPKSRKPKSRKPNSRKPKSRKPNSRKPNSRKPN